MAFVMLCKEGLIGVVAFTVDGYFFPILMVDG